MNTDARPPATGLHRRSLVKGAAWVTPVAVAAGVAPTLAASPQKINVGVSITGPATVGQGSTTTYNYVVANSGTMATARSAASAGRSLMSVSGVRCAHVLRCGRSRGARRARPVRRHHTSSRLSAPRPWMVCD